MFLGHPSPGLRAVAAESLRFVPLPLADALLAEVMRADDASKVRERAVFAASFRDASLLVATVLEGVVADPSAVVRGRMVSLLGGWGAAAEDVTAILTRVSQDDPSADVRAMAAAVIAPS